MRENREEKWKRRKTEEGDLMWYRMVNNISRTLERNIQTYIQR